MPHHMCSISCFHFLLPACAPVGVSVGSWWRGGVVGGGALHHHGSFCSPISMQCSAGSVRLGRMLYGVEILREKK